MKNMKNLFEDFQLHETLNPKLWKDNRLIPEVRQKLLEIADNFEEYVEIPMHIVDVVLVGSNASYNYTQHSDIDVHLIVNTELTEGVPEDIQTLVFNLKKTAFNKEFDIKIKEIPVELYVEDLHSSVQSNGIYSIRRNKWVKEPKPITIEKRDLTQELDAWTERIHIAITSRDYEQITDVLDALYLMRKNSISIEGEYGRGNEVFKTLRDRGELSLLKEALTECLSRKLSLEHYIYTGKFINLFES